MNDVFDPKARCLAVSLIVHARRGDWQAVNDLITQLDLGERDTVTMTLVGMAAKWLPLETEVLEVYLLAGGLDDE